LLRLNIKRHDDEKRGKLIGRSKSSSWGNAMRYLSYFLSTLIGNLLLKEKFFLCLFLRVCHVPKKIHVFFPSFLSVISSLNVFTHSHGGCSELAGNKIFFFVYLSPHCCQRSFLLFLSVNMWLFLMGTIEFFCHRL
jgi:hypothetical protein